MFDFIPIEYYTPIFYNFLLIIVIGVYLRLLTKGYVIQNPNKKGYAALTLLLVITLYIGLRPISGVFVDMTIYNYRFENYAAGADLYISRDILWQLFEKTSSSIMTAKMFFLVCASLYVFPLYKATKNWLGNDSYFLFLMFVASFSFWGYGTNGIRNGVATSVFVLGLSYYNHRHWQYLLIGLSYFIHGSMMIPIASFIISIIYNNPKHYLAGWIIAIFVSIIFGGLIESFVHSLGLGGNRSDYLTMDIGVKFSRTGFRWDFLIYSATAIYAGYYFLIKKQFKDSVYTQIFNIYITVNAFWILVIRSSFSNRFAYLSWFLMAVIIFYPLFKGKYFRNQQKVLALIILAYFGFTYFMLVFKS